MTPSPPPGWYPDPASPSRWRWWDGVDWTESVHSPAERPVTQQREAARFLRYAVWIQPLYGLAAVATANSIVDWIRSVDWDDPNPEPVTPSYSAWTAVTSPLGLLLMGAVVLWIYRVVESAVASGRPTRRSALFAVIALFIPVINFWFPYQALRDSVRGFGVTERAVRRWWLLYLATSLSGIVAFAVPFLPSAAAALVVGAIVGLGATFAFVTRTMTESVLSTFDEARNPPVR